VDWLPYSAIGLYRGLQSEEQSTQAKCEQALVAVEPMYNNYIPRLRERFRETSQNEEFKAYLQNLAVYLGVMATSKLGKEAAEAGPMSPGFFAPNSEG
jgi:hypothetical protein